LDFEKKRKNVFSNYGYGSSPTVKAHTVAQVNALRLNS